MLNSGFKALFNNLELFLVRNQRQMVLNSSSAGSATESAHEYTPIKSLKMEIDSSHYFEKLFKGTYRRK